MDDSHAVPKSQCITVAERVPNSNAKPIASVNVVEPSSGQLSVPLPPDEVNRLWQHGLHEERLFHDRLNYFSGIQAGLLGVFAILYQKEPSPGTFAPLTAVGLAFALLWLRVQVRHWHYCMHVYQQVRRSVPEYARTISTFASPGRVDGLSIARPLIYAVPLLFAATWVALFGWALARAIG